MTFLSMALSLLSMPPSCSASSTRVKSSSSVTPRSGAGRTSLDRPFLSWVKRKFTGFSTTISTRMMGADIMAKLSAFSFAMLFGETSPKTSTTRVMTMVDTVGPLVSPRAFTNSRVEMVVEAMFTRLLPTRMVESSSSYLSESS